ncbi:hypothetical protein EV702DRAFT_1042484 [Suillus placidus]|uniref:Uncharacterized protein n=1 Tax=Suillus placidus TaxID=48579 RepID=A0A9P7D6Z8_9AGAM|nr:hypothetical protein EV702DRAFT_1042484 [Suillus placidus]
MAMERAGANCCVVNGYRSLHGTSTTADSSTMSWNICRIQTRKTTKIEMWSKRVVALVMTAKDAMSIDDDHSQGTCSDIDCDESSDHSYALETPISIPDNFVFDEDANDDEYLHLSLEDIAAQLDAWANPKADGDFYDIH